MMHTVLTVLLNNLNSFGVICPDVDIPFRLIWCFLNYNETKY